MDLTATLATFAAQTPAGAIPLAVITNAKQLVLDTIGVALAASDRRIGKTISRHVAEIGGSPAIATVLGSSGKVAPGFAALANGTMAHALAMDGGNHLPTHILPAALALAEQHGRSGAEVLDAVAIGFEAGTRLTRAIGRGPTNRGWWHVGFVGPVAAAITSSRLLRLDPRDTATAIGIATCSSAGLRANMATMSQAYHSGAAARAGIEAAQLARSGFTSERNILEAPLGLFAALCGADGIDSGQISERLGAPWSLEHAYAIKPYPVCGPAQPLVEAIRKIRRESAFDIDEVESIEADLHYFSLLRPNPEDEDQAGYSGAFVLAAALVFGDVWLDQVSEASIRDPDVQALMRRVTHVASTRKGIDRVVVRLTSERELVAEIAGGTREATSSTALAKFRRCAGRVLTSGAVAELEDLILRLDRLQNLDAMMQLAGRA